MARGVKSGTNRSVLALVVEGRLIVRRRAGLVMVASTLRQRDQRVAKGEVYWEEEGLSRADGRIVPSATRGHWTDPTAWFATLWLYLAIFFTHPLTCVGKKGKKGREGSRERPIACPNWGQSLSPLSARFIHTLCNVLQVIRARLVESFLGEGDGPYSNLGILQVPEQPTRRLDASISATLRFRLPFS